MRAIAILGALLICCSPVSGQSEPVLSVAFDGPAVVVGGVTPGGSIAWVMAAREFPDAFLRLVSSWGVAADDDADGVVRVERTPSHPGDPDDPPVPELSVWGLVDETTGAFALARAPGFPLTSIALPPWPLRSDLAAGTDVLPVARQLVALMLVRPGVGGWYQSFADGGSGDLDGISDGTMVANMSLVVPLADEPPFSPPRSQAGDVLIVFGFFYLDAFAGRSETVFADGLELGDLSLWQGL